MAENSKIEWTTHTFNPWRGCTKVAAGCANCYAETLSKRNPGTLGMWGPNGTRVLASEAIWREPVKWNKAAECNGGGICQRGCHHSRPRVFCASLADVFEDWGGCVVDHHGSPCLVGVDANGSPKSPGATHVRNLTLDDLRARLFRLIDATPNLDWLLLTKRPENVRRMWPTEDDGAGGALAEAIWGRKGKLVRRRDNVWLGTSIANQEDADRNIPELLKCRDLAAKLFVSVEPLVGPVDVSQWLHDSDCHYRDGACHCSEPREVHIGWVIVGGESGPHARPCNVEWIRSIVRQCQAAGVPCFVKQVGAWPVENVNTTMPWIVRDPKGGDQSEWPEDLRVREFPI